MSLATCANATLLSLSALDGNRALTRLNVRKKSELLKSNDPRRVPAIEIFVGNGKNDTHSLKNLSIKSGGARRDRTADLLRARQALSQLSYGP